MEDHLICAFTGHRPEALPWGSNERDPRCVEVKSRLQEAVERAYRAGYHHFSCGMARGADLYFCEVVLELRREHPEVVMEAVVPCEGQSDLWPWRDQLRRQRLLEQCDMETLVQRNYDTFCMSRRNAYLVEHADFLLAIFNGDPGGGGTLATLSYAMSLGIKTEILEI